MYRHKYVCINVCSGDKVKKYRSYSVGVKAVCSNIGSVDTKNRPEKKRK